MEPLTIAVICATVFGAVTAVAVFIRQLLLSRDNKLNELAQQRALKQEAVELEKIRGQMSSAKRFDSHYQVLISNKDAIEYLDQQIESILAKKEELIHRYAELAIKESSVIVAGGKNPEGKALCDGLKQEIDSFIKIHENEIIQHQNRRAKLWDVRADLQDSLIEQERKRNKHLDGIYLKHTALLEKVYLRHAQKSENLAKYSMDASTQTFKAMIMTPLHFLTGFFKASIGISLEALEAEIDAREEIEDAEKEINGEDITDDFYDNDNTDASVRRFVRTYEKIEI